MKRKRGFVLGIGHWVNSKIFGWKDDDDIASGRNKNVSLREQYFSMSRGLLSISISKLKSINCPHCEGAIVFSRYGTYCPYCDEKKNDIFGSLEIFLFDKCTTCRNVIKYFECPHCQGWITTDKTLPETNKVAYLQTDISFENDIIITLKDLNNYGFDVEEKIVTYLKGLFHNVDMNNQRNISEKFAEMFKREMLNYELLDKQVHLRYRQCINEADTAKVALLQEGVKYFPLLSPRLKVGLINALFGKFDPNLNDLNFDEDYEKALVKAKEQEARNLLIENDLKQWKFDQNKNGL